MVPKAVHGYKSCTSARLSGCSYSVRLTDYDKATAVTVVDIFVCVYR